MDGRVHDRGRSRRAGRRLAALVLGLGVLVPGVLLLGASPAVAADPVPAPAPDGGRIDAPEGEGVFDGEHALEVAMLALGSQRARSTGSVNGLGQRARSTGSRSRASSSPAGSGAAPRRRPAGRS